MLAEQLRAAAPELVAKEAQKQKLVSAKELKKLRKEVNEKMHNALAVKSEMGSVQEQLKTLSHAVDSLSQIMVDELDTLSSDMTQTRVDASDQLATLAKGVQSFSPEISSLRDSSERCKSAVEAANTSIAKLKRWTESGFRRLNEALTVQQQALTVLDSQMAGFNDRMQEGRADVVNCRKESAESKAEFERMRTQVSQVMLSNEQLVQEYREHIRSMQTATTNCELVAAEKESRTAVLHQDISYVESQLQEHRALSEARLLALEKKSALSPTAAQTAPLSERRIAELEEDLMQARRQLSEQDDKIHELQMRMQAQTEKAALTRLSDRQEVSELISRAIQDYMRRNPPARPSASYDDLPASASVALAATSHPNSSPERRSSPLRPPSFDAVPSGAAASSRGVSGGDANESHGSHLSQLSQHERARAVNSSTAGRSLPASLPVSRVMEESAQRVADMRRESMQRQLALSRAVEEIDERIRSSSAEAEWGRGSQV